MPPMSKGAGALIGTGSGGGHRLLLAGRRAVLGWVRLVAEGSALLGAVGVADLAAVVVDVRAVPGWVVMAAVLRERFGQRRVNGAGVAEWTSWVAASEVEAVGRLMRRAGGRSRRKRLDLPAALVGRARRWSSSWWPRIRYSWRAVMAGFPSGLVDLVGGQGMRV